MLLRNPLTQVDDERNNVSTHWGVRVLAVQTVPILNSGFSARGLLVQVQDRETGIVGTYAGAGLALDAPTDEFLGLATLPGGYELYLPNLLSAAIDGEWAEFKTIESLELVDFSGFIGLTNMSATVVGPATAQRA